MSADPLRDILRARAMRARIQHESLTHDVLAAAQRGAAQAAALGDARRRWRCARC